MQRFPQAPQIAAFDTAFHRDIPEAHALYPLPWDWTERWQLRRYGFHGLSVSYAVERTQALLGHLPDRLVVCHLGAGCSVTAVERGRSIATSMGFTPLEGVMMVQRSGSIDPGLLLYLMTQQGVPAEEIQRALNDASGLLGVSGVSADLREVQRAAEAGNARAELAITMFVHRLVLCVGGMIAALNGLDALVFTGGIGEHSARVRGSVCNALAYLGVRLLEPSTSLPGVRLAPRASDSPAIDTDISEPTSPVRVLVIAAREDLAVLRQLNRILSWG
jgi:acetate kinase